MWRAWIIGISVLVASATAHADMPAAERIAAARAEAAGGDAEAQLDLVIELVDAGWGREALEELDVFDALAPADARATYWRARALLALERPSDAEANLGDALDARALALRGRLRAERGAYALALEDLQAAAAIAPSIPLERRIASLLERVGRPSDALRVLDAGVRRSGSAVLRVDAAELALRVGAYDRALAHVDALLAARGSVRLRVLRAAILRDAGRGAEADAALARARAEADARVRQRGSALALTERARLRLALGDREGARRDLVRAAHQSPRWTEPRRMLAALEAGR